MRCEAAREHLKTLFDGELGFVQAWRVRRHLPRCVACKEELEMIGRLNALLLSADLVPSGTLAPPRAGWPAVRMRRRNRVRILYPLACAAILAMALMVSFQGLNRGSSGVALAAAIEAFAGGKDWTTWHFVSTAPDGKVTETWLRRPDAFREETRRGGALTELKVQKGEESWIYLVGDKRAYHAHKAIENPALYGDAVHALKDLQERARKVGGLSVTEHPQREPDGRSARVIEIVADYAKHFGSPEGNHPKVVRFQVTVDAQTGLQLRSEWWGTVTTTIAHDQPMPDSLFTWKPPAGVRVIEIGDWLGQRLGRTLASAENENHSLAIHAVDLAANGDIWITASWKFRDASMNTWGTTPLTGELIDDRGRVYVLFTGIGGGKFGPTGGLAAYTTREQRHPGDPNPTSITLQNYGSPSLVLSVPPPAEWVQPPIDPVGVAHPERDAPFFRKARDRARSRTPVKAGPR